MDIRQLSLQEVNLDEYDLMREEFPWPCQRVQQGFLNGFARISKGLMFPNANAMLQEFTTCPNARRVSVKLDGKGWMRVETADISEGIANDLTKIVLRTGNLLYLGFRNGIFDPDVNFEIGFGREPEGRMVSVCACLPGYLRGKKYQWKGTDREYVEIYALA